jgi:formylglycine-generating enzyme required for sulfatase activity
MAAAFANGMSAGSGLPACYSCSGSGTTVTCSAPSSVYACAGYRLPTEAEWEGAARCGEDLLYAGSNSVGAVAWYVANSGGQARAVGGLARNDCGLFDMSGNVWEWTNDWFDWTAYASEITPDPHGPATGVARTLRGGSWYFDPMFTRVADRGEGAPTNRFGDLGFRLARTVP